MNKVISLLVLCSILIMGFSAPSTASAQSEWPSFCRMRSLPSHDSLYPDDQQVVVCIPPNWNGQLVMYAHGYDAVQNPLSLPTNELYLPDGTFMPDFLFAQGFAFATTSYHKNGYAVEQARKDLNRLLTYIRKRVPAGSLQKTFLVGASEGGEITAMLIEKYPDRYAGGLALCGPIGGAGYQIQYMSDFRVVFDYFFPNVFSFGLKDVPIDEYLNWPVDTNTIATAIAADPVAAAQLYSVTGAALDPANPQTSQVSTALSVLYYSIWGTNDILATAGGMPYGNRKTHYTGSLDDSALNAGVERVRNDPPARIYMRRYYQTTGELQRPLVTLHNTYDPVVPFQHEVIYQQLAQNAGSGNLFTSLVAPRYGHCNFTSQEITNAFELLVTQSSTAPSP